jgi:hypothetical protein
MALALFSIKDDRCSTRLFRNLGFIQFQKEQRKIFLE